MTHHKCKVDGKVHDKDHRKTLDRIRQRALENLGYTVHRVRNETIAFALSIINNNKEKVNPLSPLTLNQFMDFV